eukprot:CAMPEP_0177792140 /NCGR_PEP_ID=MMETSP0491_2-20121128/24362_1 /TAXON_ID=63592 /ORGANISM="Tetraselmis chuii, Strain PLY429" /LENGTH=98 /DNA_ID=CAMNT_0019314527 /DNA_START=156 /DNA_END=449 /DNA_ORIENTATION=-
MNVLRQIRSDAPPFVPLLRSVPFEQDRSAAAARPPSPPPNFLRSAGVLSSVSQDPEEVYHRQEARAKVARKANSDTGPQQLQLQQQQRQQEQEQEDEK